jgi:hypothetical protein
LSANVDFMTSNPICLLVEGVNDVKIATWLLEAAKLPLEHIAIKHSSSTKFRKFLHDLSPDPEVAKGLAVLVDVDARSIPDAVASVRSDLINYSSVEIFCAMPTIEAWLFADDLMVKEILGEESWEFKFFLSLPLPEEISNPKEMAKFFFGSSIKSWEFLKTINISRATSRSPSLRYFLSGIEKMLGRNQAPAMSRLVENMNLKIFAGLINEVVPADTTIWKTSDGETFTASQLRQEIDKGTDLGKQYASDVLRVSRDFLKSTARDRKN